MKLRSLLPSLILLGLVLISMLWQRGASKRSESHREQAQQILRPSIEGPLAVETASAEQRIANPFQVREAIEQGQAIELTVENELVRTLSFRPLSLLSPKFSLSLGPNQGRLELPVSAFEGVAFTPRIGTHRASAVIVGPFISGIINESGGSSVSFTLNSDTGETKAFRHVQESSQCSLNSLGSVAKISSTTPLQRGPIPIALGLTPSTATLGGVNPATGVADLFADPIPFSENYEASLKPLLLVMVLDKSATGSSDPANLASRTSQQLASLAHVAANYENQLGLHLLVQELILIPDEAEYEDVPVGSDVLGSFRQWMAQHRSIDTYSWSVASKWGAGLTGSTLGLAYVRTIESSASLCIQRPHTNWFTLAHEVGHALGSDHSDGGTMNSVADESSEPTFFADVTDSDTAAMQVYEHSEARLRGVARLRHAEEIPFAEPDFFAINEGSSITFDPRQNDQRNVRRGLTNAIISVEEVSHVTPPGAGEVSLEDNLIHFEPADGFVGVAWFSYSLRGSIGNQGAGWLHKGDVAILVGQPSSDPFHLTLAPGETHLLELPRAGGTLTQPTHARIDRSQDDSRLLIIRVSSDAEGQDEFVAAGETFQVAYAAQPLDARSDWYLHHPGEGELRFFPLSNDDGIGYRWLHPITPSLGVSSNSGQPYFPTTLSLIDAENLDPHLGELTVVRLPISESGQAVDKPTGEMRFRPFNEANGVVRIRYTVEDANGTTRIGNTSIRLGGSAVSLVSGGQSLRYEVPEDASTIGADWTDIGYVDTPWRNGALPIGYDSESVYTPAITSDVGSLMEGRRNSIFLRIPFTLAAPPQYDGLSLNVRFDDGFVAYLNGQEILRQNAPTTLSWVANALESHEAVLDRPDIFDVSHALPLLKAGKNVLAIQGLNVRTQSSDFLFDAELVGLNREFLARVSNPIFHPIEIPSGTGVILEANTQSFIGDPFSGAVQVDWQMTSAPPGASVTDAVPMNPLQGAFYFGTPGTYRLRLIGRDASVSTSQSFSIRVGEPYTTGIVGAHVQAGPDQDVHQEVNTLSGSVVPVTPQVPPAIQWHQLSGPADALIADSTLLETGVTLPQVGSYYFRLIANQGGFIQTFDDVVLQWNVLDRSLIGTNHTTRYLIPQDPQDPGNWTAADFDDHDWTVSGNALGYDLGGPLNDVILSDLSGALFQESPSLFVRYPFTLENPEQIESLHLHIRADDGYVAYLNGHEVGRSNAPIVGLSGSSSALRGIDDSEALEFRSHPMQNFLPLLLVGQNVLAVHALNEDLESSDFFVDVRLTSTEAVEELNLNLPIVSLPPTNIEPRSAIFITELTAGGIADAPSLIYFWGRIDGQIDPSAWEFRSEITEPLVPGRRQDLNDGLSPHTTWYHRAALRTGETLQWAPETVAFTTPPEFSPAYDQWMNGFFFDIVEARFPLSDPDGDGLSNLAEFAFDLRPDLADSSRAILRAASVDGEIELTYDRRLHPEINHLSYTLQASSQLQDASWQPLATDITWTQPISDSKERVRVLLPPNASQNFFRVKVELLEENP